MISLSDKENLKDSSRISDTTSAQSIIQSKNEGEDREKHTHFQLRKFEASASERED
jgi:hypothetical protein